MKALRKTTAAAVLGAALSLIISGCSGSDDERVVPGSGTSDETVDYQPKPDPAETRVDVTSISVLGDEFRPLELPAFDTQQAGHPIVFSGVIDDIPGGVVRVQFVRKGSRDENGRGLITNEMAASAEARDEGGCSYTVRGKTPANVDTHEIQIEVGFPEILLNKDVDRKKQKLIYRVIAEGEMSTDSDV